jgi:hypothetical protein
MTVRSSGTVVAADQLHCVMLISGLSLRPRIHSHICDVFLPSPTESSFILTLSRVAVVRTDVSENVSSLSPRFLAVICFHSDVTVESLLLSLFIEGHNCWSKNTVFWGVFTAAPIMNAFWDFVSCIFSSNRRFGERIVSIFSVI